MAYGDENTFEWYCTLVRARQVVRKNEREGQAAFNALHNVRPDLAEQVRGTGFDPFYRDDKLTDFYVFVQEKW